MIFGTTAETETTCTDLFALIIGLLRDVFQTVHSVRPAS